MTEWQLISHEVLAIKNALHEILRPHGGISETKVHHELTKGKITEINSAVEKVFLFMRERGNPYKLEEGSLKLRNFSSQVISNADEAVKHLKFFELS